MAGWSGRKLKTPGQPLWSSVNTNIAGHTACAHPHHPHPTTFPLVSGLG